MIPRITLWSPETDIDYRLAICSFFDKVEKQTSQIQALPHLFSITPGAMYILSNIAGRRIVDPIRWILLDSLEEILTGNLRTQYPEKQDLLAPTFGEILGALLLAAQLSGEVEIIRLLETNTSKVPDFLVLQSTPSGTVAHLLECKGSVEDVHNVNERQKLDICEHIRGFQSEGYAQLTQTNPDQFQTGERVVIKNPGTNTLFGKNAATLNLAVTYIPDARIPGLVDYSNVQFARHSSCTDKNIRCPHCVKGHQPRHSNLVSVIYRQELSPGKSFNDQLQDLIEYYRSTERALWAVDNKLFIESYERFVEEVADNGRDPILTSLVVALLVTAIGQGFTLGKEQLPMRKLLALAGPEQEDKIWKIIEEPEYRQNFKLSTAEPSSREMISRHISEMNIRPGERGMIREAGASGARLGGTVEYYKDAVILRVIVDQVTSQAYTDLKKLIEDSIRMFRSRAISSIDWREEAITFDGERKLELGVSWDKYPYPNPNPQNPLPGITTWVSRDGRAEVVIRLPESATKKESSSEFD